MHNRGPVWQEVRPGSSWDPDASHAAAKLSAYFELESARSSRRLLCRVAVGLAAAAAVLQALTRALSEPVFVLALLAFATMPLAAIVVEWRAEKQLSALSGVD